MMTAVVGDAAGCGPITQHQAAVCVSPGRRNNSTTAQQHGRGTGSHPGGDTRAQYTDDYGLVWTTHPLHKWAK